MKLKELLKREQFQKVLPLFRRNIYVKILRCTLTWNRIPENASIVGRGYDGTYLSFLFSDNGTRKEITITPAELNEKYPNKEPSSGACFGCEEVAYWRKAYGLEDKLYESYPRAIENCGYYKCNEEMLEAMLDYDSEVDDGYMESYDTFTTDDSDIFYHEWY